jgi:putative SOS response-associated peptidase YedK
MINARAETLTDLPSFKLLVDRRRCIIPADCFYEWRKEGKRKVPMWVHLKNRELFAFAGLWDVWRKPDGKRVESFTTITTEPNELIEPVHNRMPVILKAEDEERWLDVSRTTFTKARLLLKPLPAELMDAHDVSPIVNSAKYDARSASDRRQMTRY